MSILSSKAGKNGGVTVTLTNTTSLYEEFLCLSTAEPNFHLFFIKFTNLETPTRSGLDEVPGPSSLLIASS